MGDASNYVVEIVLGQQINKKPHVICYASPTLNDTQMNYTVTEKEFLTMVFAFENFRPYLIGSHVIVFTNHASLKHLLSNKNAKLRVMRWMPLLQEFDCKIRDMNGSENLVVDHLSMIVSTTVLRPLFLLLP